MRSILSSAAVFTLLLAGITAAQDEATLRVNVRLVHLLVTVRDAAGRLTGDLTKNDFTVTDNGIPQKIAVFERQTEQPLSVTLLIDNSGSTAKDLKYEVDSVSRFVRALFQGGNDRDRASLFSFNYEVVKQTGFTRDHSQIDHQLHQLHGEAGTALYDAIYLAADELYNREGRHVMVIVTDGGDTTSSKDYQAALEAAQRVDAVIYPVLVVPIEADAGRNVGGENALTTLAAGTGGHVFLPTLGASLDNAFTQIVNELRTQYFLAYYPHDIPFSRDRFHRLAINLDRPGLRVSTRAGYYGETDAAPASGNTRILTPY
jgi:Ca-activated chloride channel family protein